MEKIIFKFPQEDLFYSLDFASEKETLIFHSFDDTQENYFRGNLIEISKEEITKLNLSSNDISSTFKDTTEKHADYLKTIEKAIEKVKEYHLPKVVISRRKWIPTEENAINLGESFLHLAKDYPNAFVYLAVHPSGTWLGATPEFLGKFDKETNEFETMSLAGTLPVDEEWSEKEIEEQKPVTEYIRKVLQSYATEVRVSETCNQVSGNIKHLRTDLKATIHRKDLDSLIRDLHPTPAVCGVPKELCQSIIGNLEKHSRKYYAGYIRVETKSKILYFVNLRCAEIFRNGALLYAGGGITSMSNPQKEWRETELKCEAVEKRLSYSAM